MRSVPAAIVFSLLVFCFCGLAQTPAAPPALTITPDKIDFGQHAVNSQSTAVTVTISNPSQAPIVIQEILSSGIDFPSQKDCGQQLQAGAQCTVQISFKPVIVGDRTGILQITASDSPNSHFVPLAGIGSAQ